MLRSTKFLSTCLNLKTFEPIIQRPATTFCKTQSGNLHACIGILTRREEGPAGFLKVYAQKGLQGQLWISELHRLIACRRPFVLSVLTHKSVFLFAILVCFIKLKQ